MPDEGIPVTCYICHKYAKPPRFKDVKVVWTCGFRCRYQLDRLIVGIFEHQAYRSTAEGYAAVQRYFAEYGWGVRTAQRRTQTALGRLNRPHGPKTIRTRKKYQGRIPDLV